MSRHSELTERIDAFLDGDGVGRLDESLSGALADHLADEFEAVGYDVLDVSDIEAGVRSGRSIPIRFVLEYTLVLAEPTGNSERTLEKFARDAWPHGGEPSVTSIEGAADSDEIRIHQAWSPFY